MKEASNLRLFIFALFIFIIIITCDHIDRYNKLINKYNRQSEIIAELSFGNENQTNELLEDNNQ